MRNYKIKFENILLINFALLISNFAFIVNVPVAMAFSIPEKLAYDLTWGGIKAGEASLEIKNDGDGAKITSIAQSAKWVSVFYTVNDVVESRLLKKGTTQSIGSPVNYKINLREGRYRKNKEVIFDYKMLTALYIDHLAGEKSDFEIPPIIFDPISSFYYLRTLSLEVGKSVYVTIFDSKKVFEVEVQVLRKERVEVPAGEFDTIVIKPIMKSEGIFSRKGEIYIWLTDDEKRMPVMLKSKIKIGSINANLTGVTY